MYKVEKQQDSTVHHSGQQHCLIQRSAAMYNIRGSNTALFNIAVSSTRLCDVGFSRIVQQINNAVQQGSAALLEHKSQSAASYNTGVSCII